MIKNTPSHPHDMLCFKGSHLIVFSPVMSNNLKRYATSNASHTKNSKRKASFPIIPACYRKYTGVNIKALQKADLCFCSETNKGKPNIIISFPQRLQNPMLWLK